MRIAFIDFEAASLGIDDEDFGYTKGSFPIEIGIAVLDTESEEISVWDSLIRKDPKWEMSAWDPKSEAVHGIPKEAILSEKAPDATTVAQRATEIMTDCDAIVLGNSRYDGRWMDMLRKAGDEKPRFKFEAIEDLRMKGIISMDQYIAISEAYGGDVEHRAGPDAKMMAEAFLVGWRFEPEEAPRM